MTRSQKIHEYQLARLHPMAQRWKAFATSSACLALVLGVGGIFIFFDIGPGPVFYVLLGIICISGAVSWYSARRLLALVPRALVDQSNRRVLGPVDVPPGDTPVLEIQVEKLSSVSKWFPPIFLGLWCCSVLLFDYFTVVNGIPPTTDSGNIGFLVVLSLFNVSALFICFKLIPHYCQMIKINEMPESRRLVATSKSLRVPFALLPLYRQKNNSSQNPFLLLQWDDITAWIVASDSEDEGAHYLISLKNQPALRVYRAGLKGHEKKVLDYARSVGGIAITLHTNVNLDREEFE